MADPVVAKIQYAVTRGFLSFDDYETTPRWRASLELRLRAAKQAMDAEVESLNALRLFAEMGLPNVDNEEARKLGRESYYRFEKFVKPWMDTLRNKSRADTRLDLFARWYIINAPERLKKLGVDFGQLESVFRSRRRR